MIKRFVEQLDAINALADRSRGFVWRLKGEDGAASSYLRFSDDPLMIVNMSVWASLEDLRAFTYRSAHGRVYAERRQWFEPIAQPFGITSTRWCGSMPARRR